MNYTEPAKEVLKKAEKIARELDHPYVGTEHLLLAFMRVCTGVAGQILSANGVEEANLYKIVDELISPVGEVTFQEKPKRSPRLEYTLEESKEEAIRFQSEAIGTEHMLLAILREPDSVATRILLTLNVNIQKIMQDTLEVLGVDIKEYQEELQEAYQRKDGILDQYGTDLTMQAEEGKLDPVIGRKAESILVADFIKIVRETLSIFIPDGISNFTTLIQYLFEIGKTRSFNIVIDEFQEFYNIRPDVFSDMQNLWDEYRQETKINLVISGSVYSLMQKIFTDHGEPLFGRADNILCLRPFNTKVLKQIMEDFAPGYSNDDLLALYTLTGGIPKYVELFCDNQALSVDRIYDFVFSENSLFIDEGRNLLITEFGKNYGIYFSILLEIANGHYTQGEIESALGGISIGGHLSKLENVYNLITRERPIFAKPGTKKNVRYIIGDNFLNFWFKYIERNRSYIELQNFEDLRQLAKADYQTYSGRVLEKYFKQKLSEEGGFKEIGSWWETKSSANKERLNSFEIDIVALKSSGKKALIAEVKRMPENNYVHSTFMEKVEHLKHKEMAKYDIETRVLGLEDM